MKITDMTLTFLGEYAASSEDLIRVMQLLAEIKVDFVELSSDVYRKIDRYIAPGIQYILRITDISESELYPEFGRFICRKGENTHPCGITAEFQINDVREASFNTQISSDRNIRITGLDDIMTHSYEKVFATIKNRAPGFVELCPENEYFCATAIAVEWLLWGGEAVVTSFGGIHGLASTEEVLMAIRLEKRHRPNMNYTAFPELKALVEKITKEPFPERKPIIGEKIFYVESGIHVDGILKKPLMYEPFSPETVGNSRKFVIGKHSGRKSVCFKLSEKGLVPAEYDLGALLCAVRHASIEKQRGLSDEEFFLLAERFHGKGAKN